MRSDKAGGTSNRPQGIGFRVERVAVAIVDVVRASQWTVGDTAARLRSACYSGPESNSAWMSRPTSSPSRESVIPPRYKRPSARTMTAATRLTVLAPDCLRVKETRAGDRAQVPLEDERFVCLGGTG